MCDVDLRGVCYRGVDIVPDIVEGNRMLGLPFAVADITSHPLPAVDLIVCRDALVHLTGAGVCGAGEFPVERFS